MVMQTSVKQFQRPEYCDYRGTSISKSQTIILLQHSGLLL